ncbi:GTPase-associated system all-helical protein GASH [Pedobacter frigidisoli]|uniref:GTPase-associated system all-helical protein GASH n=1 Tax=Pedobacter frigidisoli TaxID=2530455 RepID=UPI00292EE71D|nr:GTPase-associated system all-helical protein GASH [Pedobacter frigidisoli]
MSYSAKALFTDWYNTATKKESSKEELQSRRKIIDGYFKDNTTGFWLGLLKIYLGISKETSPEYIDLVDKFKSNDELFSVQNTNLLRLLAGCSIAEKIEENRSYLSDMLALGICTRIGSQIDILPQLIPLAEQFWINECERGRDMPVTDVPKKLTQSFSKVVMTAGAEGPAAITVADETIKNLTLVQKDTNNLLVNANKIFDMITELQTNQKYLAEESNVLWWIFGGYSEVIGKKFCAVAPELVAIITPFELNRLTLNLPGLGKIDNMVSKIFELNAEQKKAETLGSIVSSLGVDSEGIQDVLPEIDPTISSLCPLLNALHSYTEFAGNEWKPIYEKRSGVKTDTHFELSFVSNQLYKELMLTRVLEKLQG